MCSCGVNKALHPRIIKAVKKEKYNDVAFKLNLLDESPPKIAVLSVKRTAGILHFKLTVSPLLDYQLGLDLKSQELYDTTRNNSTTNL